MDYFLIYDEESGKSLYVKGAYVMDAVERSESVDFDRYQDHGYVEGADNGAADA